MLEQLNIEDFSKNLNTKFKFYRADDEIFEGELVEVWELKNDNTLYSYAIEFLLPGDFGFDQRIIKIEHDELGTMELFIVPVWKNDLGIRYEAIFNRLVRKDLM